MGVFKCIVFSRHRGTLNIRRAASPLVRLVERVMRWEASAPQGVFVKIQDGTEPNRTVTGMMLKPTANDNLFATSLNLMLLLRGGISNNFLI
ncbi:hypothetical protein TNCV_569421 [Trichonephila clavipes]|nr:hypothetical protein TNCV_569421 [Trichonephila clavipes]